MLLTGGRGGEAPAEPKPSSAGASLSQMKTRQVDLNLPLALCILHSNLRLSHYAVAALSEGLAQLQLTGSGLI